MIEKKHQSTKTVEITSVSKYLHHLRTLKRTTMAKKKMKEIGKKIARVELTIVSYRSCPLSVNAKPNVALMRLASKPFK